MNHVKIAPLRTLEDFMSRFAFPDLQTEKRLENRIVCNLLYYQTNYLLSAMMIFSIFILMNPVKMLFGITSMTVLIWILHRCNQNMQIKQLNESQPLFSILATSYIIHLLMPAYFQSCSIYFIFSLLLPIIFILAHSS